MSAATFWIGSGDAAAVSDTVGGKGRGLDMLHRAGLRVPEGFVVTTDCYRRAVAGGLATEIGRRIDQLAGETDQSALEEHAQQLRDLVLEGTDGHAGESEIRRGYRQLAELAGADDPAVAVRSSSASEDASDRSFAGEHDSYLWVLGEEEVVAAVRRCWASLFTSRAISYRAHEAEAPAGATAVDDAAADAMAVVVQRMVDAQTAGVFMTLNPQNGDRSKICIESLWGLGEPLVSGTATPDRFLVDKITKDVLERSVATKSSRAVRDPATGRGLALVDVEVSDQDRPSMDDGQIAELAALARQVEKLAGCPQDGEFVWDAEYLYLVQARPETVWSTKPPRRLARSGSALSQVVSTLRNSS